MYHFMTKVLVQEITLITSFFTMMALIWHHFVQDSIIMLLGTLLSTKIIISLFWMELVFVMTQAKGIRQI